MIQKEGIKQPASRIQRTKKQFSRYLATGIISVGIEFSVLLLLVEAYRIHYLLANLLAFATTNLCNYFISRSWVFQAGKHVQHKEIILFFGTAAVGLSINQAVLHSMVTYLAADYRISKLAAVALVILWNFWTRKKLVFRE